MTTDTQDRLIREIDKRIALAEKTLQQERALDVLQPRPPAERDGVDSWEARCALTKLTTLFEVRRLIEWDRLGQHGETEIPNEEYEAARHRAELRLVEQIDDAHDRAEEQTS